MMKKHRIDGKDYVATDDLLREVASLLPMLTSSFSRKKINASERSLEGMLGSVNRELITYKYKKYCPIDGLMMYMKTAMEKAVSHVYGACSITRDRIALYNRALNQAGITKVKMFRGGMGTKDVRKCNGPRFADTDAYDIPCLPCMMKLGKHADELLGYFEKKEPAYSFDAEFKKLHDAKEELRRLQAQTKDKDAEVKELYGRLKEMLDKKLKAA